MVIRVACLIFVCNYGRLAMPRLKHEFYGSPRSLFSASRYGGPHSKRDAEGKGGNYGR